VPVFSFEGKTPRIHESAFIAPTATIVGEVTIEENASVWYGAVVRADFTPIVIGAGTNVQDGAVLHGPGGNPIQVGRNVTIGHGCIVHGVSIGDGSLIGNGAVLLDGAKIGAGTLVAAGAVVTPGTQIPDGVTAMGIPAEVRGPIAGTPSEARVRMNAPAYQALARRHKEGARPAE
jgi:carbonic anhydrase/acetyltransferase-like protein (isoleucine patch superfamily)